MSPVAFARPVRSAVPLPRLAPSWWTTINRESPNCSSNAAVPSVDPSFTTMISFSHPAGSSARITRSSTGRSVGNSLYTGMRIETRKQPPLPVILLPQHRQQRLPERRRHHGFHALQQRRHQPVEDRNLRVRFRPPFPQRPIPPPARQADRVHVARLPHLEPRLFGQPRNPAAAVPPVVSQVPVDRPI